MLEITQISKTFYPNTPNEVHALRGVDLHLPEGSFAAIIGTNGSGKSTLLNAIAGVFTPDEGSIQLAGTDLTSWPEHQRASRIGRVFQNPFLGTAAEMSIAENLSLAVRRGQPRGLRNALSRRTRRDISERVRSLNMGLEDRIDNPIGTLSGGQRQALTLLMSVWIRPSLLLLDEHTAALDPKSADKVAQLTREIIQQQNLTALMVTHSMQQAVDLPDRIIMMHKGAVVRQYSGDNKARLHPADLLAAFDSVRRREQLDPEVAELLAQQYR